jgi:hypothetical protein
MNFSFCDLVPTSESNCIKSITEKHLYEAVSSDGAIHISTEIKSFLYHFCRNLGYRYHLNGDVLDHVGVTVNIRGHSCHVHLIPYTIAGEDFLREYHEVLMNGNRKQT